MIQEPQTMFETPCSFTMSVRNKYFEMIKSEQKDIELRAYDDKRKKIKVGDRFILSDAENPTDHIVCEVLGLHIAPDFTSLFQKIDIRRTGFDNLYDLMDTITKFISPEKLAHEHVVGIEIKPVK